MDVHTHYREVVGVFPDLTKPLTLAFFVDTVEVRCCKCCTTVTPWGLPTYIRLDDFGLVSRSKVCRNHKLHIVFRFLSVVNGAWLLHTKYALCDWCVFKRHNNFSSFALQCEPSEHLLFFFWGGAPWNGGGGFGSLFCDVHEDIHIKFRGVCVSSCKYPSLLNFIECHITPSVVCAAFSLTVFT